MNEKEKITGEDACVMMHTALRKCCDSKITSVFYNLIHILSDMYKLEDMNAWRIFGQLVAEELEKQVTPVEALRTAHFKLSEVVLEMENVRRNKNAAIPEHVTSVMYSISCIMECFEEEDWDGMAAYLGDE